MKNVFDVTKHQRAREVNSLVKMVIDKNYSRDMIRQEIENRFNPIPIAEKESIFYEVLQKSSVNAWLLGDTILHRRSKRNNAELSIGKAKMTEDQVKDSYVIKLTNFLTGIINSSSFMVSKGNRFGEDFFSYCLHKSLNTEVFTEIDDIELFTIYLKQFAIILRNSDLFRKSNGIARIVSNPTHYKDIYLSLFYSFWIKVKWQDIFPSIPDVARELKRNKGVVIDLIINAGNDFRIADISKVIIELIGLGDSNNLILVSFLDFYFFTWMEHFGILRFTSGKREELVNASITEHGRRFLKHLQSLKI